MGLAKAFQQCIQTFLSLRLSDVQTFHNNLPTTSQHHTHFVRDEAADLGFYVGTQGLIRAMQHIHDDVHFMKHAVHFMHQVEHAGHEDGGQDCRGAKQKDDDKCGCNDGGFKKRVHGKS